MLLLLLLAAICCSVQATTLTITVKDDVDLTPVSGVSIYMNGDYLGSTDINGRFYLYHSETGSFRLSVEKSGFYNWQSLVSNSKTYLTVELQRKTQVLTVSLYDSGTLDPISGALVKVTGGD
ncbi:MAG: PEGA domain-containing protein, partial [Methanogenium sp.]|nr:PEGA domain-containing protein [Methanogenium sp.]